MIRGALRACGWMVRDSRPISALRACGWMVCVTVAAIAACSAPMPTAPVEDPLPVPIAMARTPFVARRVQLPEGARAYRGWMGDEGQAVVSTLDGRFFAIDPRGIASPIDRVPGETPTADDVRVSSIVARAPGELLALTTGSGLLVQNAMVRSAQLPMFLHGARTFTRFGDGVLWATRTGLFLGSGSEWIRIDDAQGPVTDAEELATITVPGAREVWFRAGTIVRRLRMREGERPLFIEMPTNIDLGTVHGLASMGDDRAVVVTSRGVLFLRQNAASGFGVGGGRLDPDAVAGGGGYAWVLWATDILRTDGVRWEALARDPKIGQHSRIYSDTTGNSALVIDDEGGIIRVDVEERVRLSGVRDGEVVVSPTTPLEVVPWRDTEPTAVEYYVDDEVTPSARRTSAPWGWGYRVEYDSMGRVIYYSTGERLRETATQVGRTRGNEFVPHQVRVVVWYGETMVQRTIGFAYQSPFGRVPTYEADIEPLYRARCARCHSNSVAVELSTYELLSGRKLSTRLALRERRMPPDIPLDPVSEAIFLAWIDGDVPLR
jgi:hypothetical protein